MKILRKYDFNRLNHKNSLDFELIFYKFQV
jgi:hypothetical protein